MSAVEEVYGVKELVELILQGITRSNEAGDGEPIRLLCRDDGTVQAWCFQVGNAPNGDTVIGVENTGEQRMVLVARDTAAALQDLRVNPRDELQIDSHGFPVHTNPTDLTTTGLVTVHTVPAGAIDTVEFEFNLHTGPNTDITVYIVPSGGSATVLTQRWEGRLRDEDDPQRIGVYHLEAGGTIQVQAGTANRASVQPIVWRKTL